ncbi:hypothetical protein Sjap_021796 [Stephania japonica]|uniref:Uncharacterized protein n=1 Tax=Stephania japonica TaxID=461633 RepID=A0AAP0HS30_9MAGN
MIKPCRIPKMVWVLLVFLLLAWSVADAAPPSSITKLGCQDKCGKVSIPYPFGLGDDSNCYEEAKFKLICNKTFDPPLLFLEQDIFGSIPIIDISLLKGQLTILLWMSSRCNTINGSVTNDAFNLWLTLNEGYKVSNTRNKFVVIGCDTLATMKDSIGNNFHTGCLSFCTDVKSVINGSCTGIGCCETAIPKGVDSLNVSFASFYNHTKVWSFNPCSYAFLADDQWFKFYVADLWSFPNRVEYKHKYGDRNVAAPPVVIDWAVGNLTCNEVLKGNPTRYACGRNTTCSDSENAPGYHCLCKQGFEGNPYLLNGCQDVDECADPEKNSCVALCSNTEGSFKCSCPSGFYGDGINVKKGGSGCTASKRDFPLTQLIIGTSFGVLLVLIGSSVLFWALQKRKLMKSREKFFQQNGGMFLRQQLSSHDHSVETVKIFTSEELKRATDNYNEHRILGQGGYGTVYKGILSDNRVVAIKKSKVIDKAQIEQFINEVLILSQINHRNVVKLLGCCLETEVPLLVYEYITNGTLHHHIHDQKHKNSLSWSKRLRIASETAGALAYLHSAASQPIIHRDVKSTNILLDDNYIAKVSDFGASRLFAFDQTQLSTLVQGTMGYLDPEYMHTSLLTDKSDVYSFGVVLVELLTARKVLSFEEPEERRNLAMYFLSSLKENRLIELLDQRVVEEGDLGEIHEIANLARQCLRLHGEERPTMKEVAMELQGLLRVSQKHAWMEQDPEETIHLLGEVSLPTHETDPSYASVNQVSMSLDVGR